MSREGWTIAASLAGLPFIVPHVVEDFGEGIAQRVGLATPAAAFLLGLYLAGQMLGLVWVGRGRRAGRVVTFWASAIWTVVAGGGPRPAGPRRGFQRAAAPTALAGGLPACPATAPRVGWRGLRAG